MRQPTDDEVENNTTVEFNGVKHTAIWYPQMGGYRGKCWVSKHEESGCFDVHVFHDGDYPFDDESERDPITTHYCDADQLIEFAERVKAAPASGVKR